MKVLTTAAWAGSHVWTANFRWLKGFAQAQRWQRRRRWEKKLIKCGWWKSNDKIKSNAKVAYYTQPAKEGAKVDKRLGVFSLFFLRVKNAPELPQNVVWVVIFLCLWLDGALCVNNLEATVAINSLGSLLIITLRLRLYMHPGWGYAVFYGFAFLLRFVWRLNEIQLRAEEQLKKTAELQVERNGT